MQLRHILSAAALVATSIASHAAPTVISFDDLGSGVSVGAAYAGLGVTFSNATTGSFGSLPGGSSPIAVFSTSSGSAFGPANSVVASFASAMATVSVTGLDVGAAGIVLTAYDALVGGSVVDSATFFGSGVGIGTFHTLTVSGIGIMRVAFSQAAPCCGDGTVFDNLSFEAGGSVPSPATPALLGLGLLALGLTARRAR